MTSIGELNSLYISVVNGNPEEIKKQLSFIPDQYKQEALDIALEKAIILSLNPKLENIKFLLKNGANPNGPSGEGRLANYAFDQELFDIFEILYTSGADLKSPKSHVLETAIKTNNLKYIIRFVEKGEDIKDLVDLVTDPIVKKYLGKKNLISITNDIETIKTPQLSDFKFINPDQELIITEKGSDKIIVRGHTKIYSQEFKKMGGKYIRTLKDGPGWVLKKEFKDQIIKCKDVATDVKNVKTCFNVSKPDDKIIKTILTRPSVQELKIIEIYSPIGEYGPLATSFSKPNLFIYNGFAWDSVERFLMYEMYSGTIKGKEIKNAETLAIARYKFNVTSLPLATSPKQLILNQKLIPLVNSKINIDYINNFEKLFYSATSEKIKQNNYIEFLLNSTGKIPIVNRTASDMFGYESNLLGVTLMKIRGTTDDFSIKTNNMSISKYKPDEKDPKFYVIRGNPTPELALEIQNIGTFKSTNGRIIHGRLNLNLKGGAGWLIPLAKRNEAKELLFDTWPEEKQIEIYGRTWIKKHLKLYLYPAIVFSKLRNKQEVGSDSILFSIKDIFALNNSIIGSGSTPHYIFSNIVTKLAKRYDCKVSESSIQLLWDTLSQIYNNIPKKIKLLKEYFEQLDNKILDQPINIIDNLTERESILVNSFIRVYKLLRKINEPDETKICISTINIILDKHYYEDVRQEYAKKVKMGGNEKNDFEKQLSDRYKIKTNHISNILALLPKLSKKCKLLVFTMIDYVTTIDDLNAIDITKKLILLASVPMPEPTPIKTPAETDKKKETPSDKDKKKDSPDEKDKKKDSPDDRDKKKDSPDDRDKKKSSPEDRDKKKSSPDDRDKKKDSPEEKDKKKDSPDEKDKKKDNPDDKDKKKSSPDDRDKKDKNDKKDKKDKKTKH
jgi:hypothetical protein